MKSFKALILLTHERCSLITIERRGRRPTKVKPRGVCESVASQKRVRRGKANRIPWGKLKNLARIHQVGGARLKATKGVTPSIDRWFYISPFERRHYLISGAYVRG